MRARFVVVLTLAAIPHVRVSRRSDSDTAFVRAARMLDVRTGTVTTNATVIVSKGVITAVGTGLQVPRVATVIDLGATTLLPGLINLPAAESSDLTGEYLLTYYSNVDMVFKALADPSRRELLDRLFRRNGQTLLELSQGLDMTRFGVMSHLSVLQDAGLVTARKVGREKHHYLNPVPIRLVHDRWVSKYTAPFAAALSQLKHTLEGPMQGETVQRYEVYIAATPKRVWKAITDATLSKQVPYFFEVQSSFRAGEPIRWVTESGDPAVEGKIFEVNAPHVLAHTWVVRYDPNVSHETSRVTWRLDQRGKLTKLAVEHDVSGAPLTAAQIAVDGWSFILSGIKTLVETGNPIPMVPQMEGN